MQCWIKHIPGSKCSKFIISDFRLFGPQQLIIKVYWFCGLCADWPVDRRSRYDLIIYTKLDDSAAAARARVEHVILMKHVLLICTSTGLVQSNFTVMAEYDLTSKIGSYLDRHLVFPLLEFLAERKVTCYEDRYLKKWCAFNRYTMKLMY